MRRRSFLASAISLLGVVAGITPAIALPEIETDLVPIPFDEWEVTPIYENTRWDGRVMVSKYAYKGYRTFEIKAYEDIDDLELSAFIRCMYYGRIAERRRWFQSQDNILVA